MPAPPGFLSFPIPIAELCLSSVLRCGQSFRWHTYPLSTPGPTHEYRFCLKDRVVCLRQTDNTLYYRTALPEGKWTTEETEEKNAETLEWILDYCQLNVNLVDLYDTWSAKDSVFRQIRAGFVGIRILRQDPFENLISFICSSNNNISRITKMVLSLCKQFSPPLLELPDPNDHKILHTYHPFPTPSSLATEGVSTTLRTLGFGYRAEYVHRTARMLVESHGAHIPAGQTIESAEVWLRGLRSLNTNVARDELLKFFGVGRKVADCVLLMSLDKPEVIPVDTHVRAIAIRHYGVRSSKSAMTAELYDEINLKLVSIWGKYAGWAHTVLFTADLKAFASSGAEKIGRGRKRKLESPLEPLPGNSIETIETRHVNLRRRK